MRLMTRSRFSRPDSRIRGRLAVGAVIAVGAVALVARATLAGTPSNGSYRTAAAAMGTVRQTVQRTGAVEPVAQATVAFPVSGTVSDVAVKVGDNVTTGQVLASLDTSSLRGALLTKEAALASAQLALNQVLTGQTPTAGNSSTSSASPPPGAQEQGATPAGTTSAIVRTASTSTAGGELGAAQSQVLEGQKQVDADLGVAQVALQSATAACSAPEPSAPGPSPTGTGTTSTTSSAETKAPAAADEASAGPTTTEAAPQPRSTTTGLGTSICLTAQQQALTAQQALAGAQQALSRAATALDELLGSAVSAAASAGAPGASSAPTGSGTAGPPITAGPSPRGTSTTAQTGPTAAQLVAAQAAVDAAAAAVGAAQQNLDQATIVSPIPGTVAVVNLAAGQAVTSSSPSANVVVVGPGGWEVSTTVSVADLDRVKVGNTATIVPDGTTAALEGRIVSIGVSPVSGGTTTVYPVVIGLAGSPTDLRNGASASVTIEVARSDTVLTVPTSAVRTLGGRRVVTVISNGKPADVRVEVGTVGADLTEITSGLSTGQEVVLADLNQALPASNVTSRQGPGAGFAGFGGGGGGAGAHAAGGGG